MKKTSAIHTGLLALALSLSSNSFAQSPLSAKEFYQRTAPSVWLVNTFDADGIPLGTGSAVIIAPGQLITNCHVIEKAKRVTVRQAENRHEATLRFIDVERDLCQLQTTTLRAPGVVIGNSDKIAVGDQAYTLGNPQGLSLTLAEGLISALRNNSEGKLMAIQTTAAISQGSSGGGLFDAQGRLVGITTWQVRNGQNLNFAVPINWLNELEQRSQAALNSRRTQINSTHAVAANTNPVAPPTPANSNSAQSANAQRVRPVEVVNRMLLPPTAFAPIEDISGVEKAGGRCPKTYEEYLTRPLPRAFAIATNGKCTQSWTTTPGKGAASQSPDPAVRALANCEAWHGQGCRIYSIDGAVVWTGNKP
jgi:serine protease Do